MKIKTYTHRDMRSALRQSRDDKGPDAVFASSRHRPNGVKVTVAVDPEAVLAGQLQSPPQPAQANPFADVLARAVTSAAPAPAADAQLGEELRTMRHLLE